MSISVLFNKFEISKFHILILTIVMSSLKYEFIYFLYAYMYFTCMCVSTQCTYLVLLETRWLTDGFELHMWMLGTKLSFSARKTNALKHGAILLAHDTSF